MRCAFVSPFRTADPEVPARRTIQTTLYDLVSAVDEAVQPGEEALVTPIVVDLLRYGKMAFLADGGRQEDRKQNFVSSPLTN